MTTSEQLARRMHNGAVAVGITVLLAGALVLAGGWWLDIAPLRQPVPPYTAVSPAAALGVILCGVGLTAVGLHWSPWVAALSGTTAVIVGLGAIGAAVGDADSAVQKVLALGSGGGEVGRVTVDAAACLFLAGTALLLLTFERADGVRQAIGIAVALIGYAGVLGFAASAPKIGADFTPGPTELTFYTALPLLAVGLALVLVSVERGWGRVFVEPLAGGRVVRSLLPAVGFVLLLATVGYALIEDLSGPDVSAGAVAIAAIAVVVTIGLLLVSGRLEEIDTERMGLATDIEGRIRTRTLDLQQATSLMRAQFDGAPHGVALASQDGRWLDVNDALCRILGYSRDELLATDPTALVVPEDRGRARALLNNPRPTLTTVREDVRQIRHDGQVVWVRQSVGVADDEHGHPLIHVCHFEDITQQVLDRQALAESEQLFRLTLEGAPQGTALIRPDLSFLRVNPAMCSMLARDPQWLLSHGLGDVIHAEDLDDYTSRLSRLVAGDARTDVGERRWLRADGSSLWVMHSTAVLRDDRHEPSFFVCHVQDNSEAHRRGQELARRASRDSLTGLVNREQLQDHLNRLIALRDGSFGGIEPVLLFCDLDHFKTVNDNHGHGVGDEVLRTAARRITTALRSDDLVARLGGDEFVVVLARVPDQASAVSVAEKIRTAIGLPLEVGAGRHLHITVSVGIALFTPGIDALRLLGNADAALYRAKNAGRNRVSVFEDPAKAHMAVGIRDGLAHGEFTAWFQPIVDITDGGLVGFEALARWVRRDGNVFPPDRFLSGEEDTELIAQIDLAVAEHAVERLGTLPDPLHIAVNVSPTTLVSPAYRDRIAGACDRFGADPGRLHLECPEPAMNAASNGFREVMRDIARLGVRWYVDKFGTGVSSVAHLRAVPADGVKLDRTLVAALGVPGLGAEPVTRAVVGLAAGLGLDTVAAGIETRDQAAVLQEQGWQHGQGHLYGGPEPLW